MASNPYSAPAARVADVDAQGGLEVTWGRAARVWWSLVWRVLLFGAIAGFLAGALVGGIAGAAGVNPQTISLLGSLTGMAVGIPIGIWVVRWVLRKSWSGFRIVLMPK
jgi:hypothetical protein